MLNSLQNGRCSFIFPNPTYAYNHRYNLHQIFVPLPQTLFTFLFHSYLFAKSSLQSPLRLPSSITKQLFISHQSKPKVLSLPQFPYQQFSQCRLRQGTRKLGSLVGTNTVLISRFFLKLRTVITGFKTTDSFSLRLKKLLKLVVSDEDASDRNGKPFSPASLISLTYYHYLHSQLIPSQELTFPKENICLT